MAIHRELDVYDITLSAAVKEKELQEVRMIKICGLNMNQYYPNIEINLSCL